MKNYKHICIYSLLALVIGTIVGITAGLFGEALHWAEYVRINNYKVIVPFLGVAGVLILFLYKKISPFSEQGLNLAIEYNLGNVNNRGQITKNKNINKTGKYPKAYALLKLVSNITMLFFGASTGKEGSFAAFGASIGDYAARIFKSRKYSRILLISGVAAAVSGLFQTPLGGVFFALEFTTAGVLCYPALIPAVISSYTAYFFSKLLGFQAFGEIVKFNCPLIPKNILLIIVCSIIFGLTGRLFAVCLSKLHKLYNDNIKNRYWGIFIIGSAMAVIFILLGGRYCGTGSAMIADLYNTGYFKLYDFALKFIFTIICITIGFSGGEMMPLLTIGATLGATLSAVTGLPLELMASIGCVAVYASATNTLVAPIFIGIEMFGSDTALYVAIGCIIAYAINGNKSVYTRQRIHK